MGKKKVFSEKTLHEILPLSFQSIERLKAYPEPGLLTKQGETLNIEG